MGSGEFFWEPGDGGNQAWGAAALSTRPAASPSQGARRLRRGGGLGATEGADLPGSGPAIPLKLCSISCRGAPSGSGRHPSAKVTLGTPSRKNGGGHHPGGLCLPAWWPDKAPEAHSDAPCLPPSGPEVCQRGARCMAVEGATAVQSALWQSRPRAAPPV